MKNKRLAWAKEYKNWTLADWKKVMFSDETDFFVGGKHSRFVRSSGGFKVGGGQGKTKRALLMTSSYSANRDKHF